MAGLGRTVNITAAGAVSAKVPIVIGDKVGVPLADGVAGDHIAALI